MLTKWDSVVGLIVEDCLVEMNMPQLEPPVAHCVNKTLQHTMLRSEITTVTEPMRLTCEKLIVPIQSFVAEKSTIVSQ